MTPDPAGPLQQWPWRLVWKKSETPVALASQSDCHEGTFQNILEAVKTRAWSKWRHRVDILMGLNSVDEVTRYYALQKASLRLGR
jgi:hypothetical protein